MSWEDSASELPNFLHFGIRYEEHVFSGGPILPRTGAIQRLLDSSPVECAGQGEFRISYRVGTASWLMAVFLDYKTGENAVLLSRHHQDFDLSRSSSVSGPEASHLRAPKQRSTDCKVNLARGAQPLKRSKSG
jgi:hypothetical protein